jgi:hypothetical protein
MTNIEVRIDGEPIDLVESARLPVALTNPHLSYETIPNSLAAVPNIPFSLRNQQLFEFAEMPQAGNQLRRYLCEMVYNGSQAYRGLAWVKSSNPATGYQLEVSDDLDYFFGEFQNLTLDELDLGSIPLPDPLTPTVSHDGQLALCFPTIVNPDYYGTNGASVGYGGRVNPYSEGAYTEDGPLVPMLLVNYLLHRIGQLTGVTLSGSYLTHPTWSKLILTNWRALDGDTEVTVNRHVPAWTIPQFIIELRKVPNLEYIFDATEKRLTINFWEEKLSLQPIHDWTGKATPGHDKYPEKNRRLLLTFELDGNDSLMKDKPEAMADYLTPPEAVMGTIEVGLVKVTLRLSTFLIDDVTGLPMARQSGVTSQFNQLGVGTAPRLLFWHGLVGGLPIALPELDGISLYLSGPQGIAATSWKHTEAMRMDMFYLKKGFILTETDLARLDFTRSIHYRGLNYLVAHVAGELPATKEFTCLLVKT